MFSHQPMAQLSSVTKAASGHGLSPGGHPGKFIGPALSTHLGMLRGSLGGEDSDNPSWILGCRPCGLPVRRGHLAEKVPLQGAGRNTGGSGLAQMV